MARRRLRPPFALACVALVAWAATAAVALAGDRGPNAVSASGFRAAAARYGLPVGLLEAVGYADTHWRMGSAPSIDGGYGTMNLNRSQLFRAARLTKMSPARIARDAQANLNGGAALLAAAAGDPRPRDLAGWYRALARYGGGRAYADDVYGVLARGAKATIGRRRLVLAPRRSAADAATVGAAGGGDYPQATWYGASSSNFTHSWRPASTRITRIVIHVTDSSWGSAINWFNNPSAKASAHYVVRSSDGAIAQTVWEHDIAWHAGNWQYNQTAIGIEHEAIEDDCSWYTDTMYRSSARLVAHLTRKYAIPIDRNHIIGHYQVPDPNHPGEFGGAEHHTDPGSCWNWDRYMSLVHEYARGMRVHRQPSRGILWSGNAHRFRASHNWHRGPGNSYSEAPADRGAMDPARFKFLIHRRGRYALFMQWPAIGGASSAAPVGVKTTSGIRWVDINESALHGNPYWIYVGSFELARGPGWDVLVGRRTKAGGRIVAHGAEVVSLAHGFTVPGL